jgi:hypothetical protein
MRPILLLAAVVGFASPAHAITIDGQLDAAYGSALCVQTTQTNFGDSQLGLVTHAAGSEWDAGYGAISQGTLYLLLAGNLGGYYLGSEMHPAHRVYLFLDSTPGGENPVRADAPQGWFGLPASLAGMTFDTDFVPDHFFEGWIYDLEYVLHLDYAELPTDGGGAAYLVGYAAPGGPGTLTGGTNPYGILAACDNSNTVGVTAGCDAGSGAGVTRGLELAIPLAAIGDPAGCVKVLAMGYSEDLGIMNQVLGPVPPGVCALGKTFAAIALRNLAGDQFFTVCPGATPVRHLSWGSLKVTYR